LGTSRARLFYGGHGGCDARRRARRCAAPYTACAQTSELWQLLLGLLQARQRAHRCRSISAEPHCCTIARYACYPSSLPSSPLQAALAPAAPRWCSAWFSLQLVSRTAAWLVRSLADSYVRWLGCVRCSSSDGGCDGCGCSVDVGCGCDTRGCADIICGRRSRLE